MERPRRLKEYAAMDEKPVEAVKLECCGMIEYIPIRDEEDYLLYASGRYKYDCNHCGASNPEWVWPSTRKDVKLITQNYDTV